mgnify:CR=1 FL=1
MFDTLKLLRKKKDKQLASLLDDMEQVLPPESREFSIIRKITLDAFNDYYRQVYKIFLGVEVEGQTYL